LTFESTIDTVFAGGKLGFRHSVRADLPLKVNTEFFGTSSTRLLVEGIGSIRHTDARVTALPEFCKTQALDFSGEAIFDATLGLPGDLEKFNTSEIVLGYNPRLPPSKITIKCEDNPETNYANWWSGTYLYLHADEFGGGTVSNPVLFTARRWTLTGSGSPFATKNYTRAAFPAYGTLNERTTLKLDRTPE